MKVLWRRKDGCEAEIKGCGGVLWWKSVGAYFIAEHTLLQGCQPVAAVLVKCAKILAWEGVWECSVEERMDVRQRSRGVGGVQWWKSEGAYFLAEHTLLHVCHHVAATLEKCTTIIAYCELSVEGRDLDVSDYDHSRAGGLLCTVCRGKSPWCIWPILSMGWWLAVYCVGGRIHGVSD